MKNKISLSLICCTFLMSLFAYAGSVPANLSMQQYADKIMQFCNAKDDPKGLTSIIFIDNGANQVAKFTYSNAEACDPQKVAQQWWTNLQCVNTTTIPNRSGVWWGVNDSMGFGPFSFTIQLYSATYFDCQGNPLHPAEKK